MSVWYRVFGTLEAEPDPAAMLAHLRQAGWEVATVRFRRDEQGWFAAELLFAIDGAPLRLDRYLASEDGIRDELNTWAAWVETQAGNPNQSWLMQHLIGVKQVFTLENPMDNDNLADMVQELFLSLCRFLAQATAGVYQVDAQGFFAANGEMLMAEPATEF